MKSFKKYALPALQLIGAAGLCMLPEFASAMNVGAVAQNVSGNFTALADLISGGAYLGGAGLGIQAALKFKAHNENPQQVKLSQPMVYALVAASLLALPSFIGTASDTMWGGSQQSSQLGGGGSAFGR